MARRKIKDEEEDFLERLHPDTKRSIWAIAFLGIATLLVLAGFDKAGPFGNLIHQGFVALVGWGYFVIPGMLLVVSGVLVTTDRKKVAATAGLGSLVFTLAVLGVIHIISPGNGGWLGVIFGSLKNPFGEIAATVLNVVLATIGLVVTVNTPIRLPKFAKKEVDMSAEKDADMDVIIAEASKTKEAPREEKKEEKKEMKEMEVKEADEGPKLKKLTNNFKNYVPPPLDLLKASNEKPTTGDLRANANIIKRTLESFGIAVEMGEINIGPKVTRYTLKPAEGVKLSRILALSPDLALALAAHPIRIEAPIPGKSFVGIEVPNKAAAIVRLGSLMAYPEFGSSGALGFTLGRDVTGEPLFADIEKMPHLLVAGATGSGKSVMIHSIILSLLYKNSPQSLRMVLIDPKRVELSIYENLPHLVSPVITESKKAAGVFKWAIAEMERRYQLLQAGGNRDVKSYNASTGKDDPLPYVVIVADELADIMTTYGREVEGSIVRLAQMARATGIHLILATQRPSVEVITGLIKANITTRIALQVASQIDSRTILDTAGAEKLLGGGDLLFTSASLSKPKRIQGAYVSEEEINAVADFIRENNPLEVEGGIGTAPTAQSNEGEEGAPGLFDSFAAGEEADDELYGEALETVRAAGKASASLLQRRLKVGYARAARLLDLMEEHGAIGPGDGAKPREVFGTDGGPREEGFGQE